jgi:cyclic pyranopterin phosphate synthase
VKDGRVFGFEEINGTLPVPSCAARRALEVVGLRLSFAAWETLPLDQRRALVALGSADDVDHEAVKALLAGAEPQPSPTTGVDESWLGAPNERLLGALGALGGQRLLSDETWAALTKLERYALHGAASVGGRAPQAYGKLRAAYDEIVGARAASEAGAAGLTHLSPSGAARMVDVGDKPRTLRQARASAVVRMLPETAERVVAASGPKGDVLAVARIAGIMAAKRTPDLIPLCHGIALTEVTVDFEVDVAAGCVTVEATTVAHDRTGVEMEAMVAASVAALTVYDMLKAVERGIVIEQVVLLEKSGGRSGQYRRPSSEAGP